MRGKMMLRINAMRDLGGVMMKTEIQYANLRAEMARQKLTLKMISEKIHMNRDTLSRKLSGKSPLYLDEAFKVQKTFFPEKDVEYLFSTKFQQTKQAEQPA